MTHLPTLATLALLGACTASAPADPSTSGTPSTASVPSVTSGEGTQVGGEGTQEPTTCASEDDLPLDTTLDDGTTLAEALAVLDEPLVGMPLWFDDRDEALELTATLIEGSARRDGYCQVLVDVQVVITTTSGDVAVDAPVTMPVRSDYLSGHVDLWGADWQGGLDEVDVIDEACVLSDIWRVSVRWIDGLPTGYVSVRCDPWSGGGGADTGMGDTGGTDTSGSTATAFTGTTTGTTTDVDTTGGDGGEGDPQLGWSVDVVTW